MRAYRNGSVPSRMIASTLDSRGREGGRSSMAGIASLTVLCRSEKASISFDRYDIRVSKVSSMLKRGGQPVREHCPYIFLRHGKSFVPITLLWCHHGSFNLEAAFPPVRKAFPPTANALPPVGNRSLFLSYLVLILITLTVCLPHRSTLISPSLTSSAIALALVLLGIFTTSSDSTIGPPICSRLNASIRIARASRYVFTLLDCRSASAHRTGHFTQRTLKRGLLFFFPFFDRSPARASFSVI
jgi:hypothetical protein